MANICTDAYSKSHSNGLCVGRGWQAHGEHIAKRSRCVPNASDAQLGGADDFCGKQGHEDVCELPNISNMDKFSWHSIRQWLLLSAASNMDSGTDALRKVAVAPTEKCVGRCKFEPVLSAVEEFVVAHNGLPQGGDGKDNMLARDWKLLVLYVRSNPYMFNPIRRRRVADLIATHGLVAI